MDRLWRVIMDVPHDRRCTTEEKQRLLNALNDLDEPANDSAGIENASEKVLTADEASGHTDHGPPDFFNTYNGFDTFDKLGNDMSWTSMPRLWSITASTERHEWHRLKTVKNRRLQKQVERAKKSETKQFRSSGRPPRHCFELLRTTGEREIAEAISSCFGQTLQHFTFETSTQELQAENNNAEELDPRDSLTVKMYNTEIGINTPTEEIRSRGKWILVRDADETQFFENDVDGIGLICSVNTSDVIRLVVPNEPDSHGHKIYWPTGVVAHFLRWAPKHTAVNFFRCHSRPTSSTDLPFFILWSQQPPWNFCEPKGCSYGSMGYVSLRDFHIFHVICGITSGKICPILHLFLLENTLLASARHGSGWPISPSSRRSRWFSEEKRWRKGFWAR